MSHLVKVAPGLTNVQVGSQTGDAGDILTLTDAEYASIAAGSLDGDPLIDLGEDNVGPTVLSFPIDLAQIAGTGDVVTNYPLQGNGRITQVAFVVTVPVTTAAKAATLNLEIGSTNLTGGVVALTSANATPLGKVIVGTAVTANNTFSDGDTLSIESAAVTAFVEGRGVLLVTVE
jgi:hypothetical protein